MDDHQEDLYEFVINHVGMTSQESKNICKTTHDALHGLSSNQVILDSFYDEVLTPIDYGVEKKTSCIHVLTSVLSNKWAKMGLNELKIRVLIHKYIPFVVSILFYKLDEKHYESQELIALSSGLMS